RFALNEINDTWELDSTIWKSCRNEPLTQKTSQFIYKTIQGAFKIGDFWNRIPNYEIRAKCGACGHMDESMEHILLECPANGQTEIWQQVKNLWQGKNTAWPNIKIGTIMGCGAITITPQQDENNPITPAERAMIKGESRLMKILISESAHLIWTARCDRTINGNPNPPTTMISRWYHQINRRLHTDRLRVLNKIDKNTKYHEALTQHTWTGTIQSEKSLPYDWVKTREVLVGIKSPGPSM
ncbi:hypothetical protein BV22DRAFT_1011489, partial [Leucogyrophana mollusca]